jgi:ribose transport system substrate-binding protein
MTKGRTATLLAATIALIAMGATAATAADPIRIAGVYRNTADAYWVTAMCAAEKEAKKLGVELKTFSIAVNDNTQLSQVLDAALLTQPQGLLFAPADNKTFATKIGEIMAQGIPVIGENPQEPDTMWKVIQTSQDGSLYVEPILAALAGVEGKAVVLNGLPAASAAWETQRYGAIQEALKVSNPKLEWLPELLDNFDVTKGTQLISGTILANPDLKVIIASSGPGGQAAAAAVKQAGLSGQIVVIGFDAVPAEVDALRDGTITFLGAQGPGEVAAAQVRALVDYIKANPEAGPVTPTHETEYLPLGLLTKDNVNDPSMVNYIYSSKCEQ